MTAARFEGKVAYVTGASSGIGEGIALRLADEGAYVVLIGRDQARLDAALATCGGKGAVASFDVGSSPEVAATLPGLIAEHGAPDVVVHAAGQTVVGALDELSEDEWDRQMNVNLKSIYLLNKHLWPAMVPAGGSIVTIASTASFGGFPQDAAYVASKGAVLLLTKAMAIDGGPVGIRVNAVCPGFILTPNLQGYFDSQPDPEAAAGGAGAAAPLGRMGTPAEVASAAAYLASDDAAFITGTSLVVDGGLLARVPTS
jgi:NAD(P)-dependent dehydrogenase (short-subunit alcohol dehydrogenase family)